MGVAEDRSVEGDSNGLEHPTRTGACEHMGRAAGPGFTTAGRRPPGE